MNMDQVNQILHILFAIDLKINEKTLTIDDLKNLLLITYNECLTDYGFNSNIIKEYLTMVIKHFIQLEEESAEIITETQNDSLISAITHERVPGLKEES